MYPDSSSVCLAGKGSGSGALGLLSGSSLRGTVSFGSSTAVLFVMATLVSTTGDSAARLELTLKCSDVAILAAAHECMSWRLQEWQRMQPSKVCLNCFIQSWLFASERQTGCAAGGYGPKEAHKEESSADYQFAVMQMESNSQQMAVLERAKSELLELQGLATALQVSS